MSPKQDKRKEESPSAGDYPETQPSEQSTTNSNRATQGSHDSPPTPSSPAASSSFGHDLSTHSGDVAPDPFQNWFPEVRPPPEFSTKVMGETITRIMAPFEGDGAVEGAPANDAVTKTDPTPPSDG